MEMSQQNSVPMTERSQPFIKEEVVSGAHSKKWRIMQSTIKTGAIDDEYKKEVSMMLELVLHILVAKSQEVKWKTLHPDHLLLQKTANTLTVRDVAAIEVF